MNPETLLLKIADCEASLRAVKDEMWFLLWMADNGWSSGPAFERHELLDVKRVAKERWLRRARRKVRKS